MLYHLYFVKLFFFFSLSIVAYAVPVAVARPVPPVNDNGA